MDKLIYLFELDSTRNSNKEIEIAQKTMFKEIVVNGNIIVLTFNQLTDSRAFLSALEDPEQYDSIIELFKLGRIKISLYNKYKTASQYLMDAVRKCIQNVNQSSKSNDEKISFIFSALPINTKDKILLKRVYFSLRYNDLRALKALLQERKNKHTLNAYDANDIENIEKVIQYVKLAMVLDTHEIPYIKARPSGCKLRKLSGYLKLLFSKYLVSNRDFGYTLNDKYDNSIIKKEDYKQALEILRNIYESKVNINPSKSDSRQTTKKNSNNIICQKIDKTRLNKFQKNKNSRILSKDSRSDWYKLIEEKLTTSKSTEGKQKKSNVFNIAYGIIDMCYNFTTKESISGVYNTFKLPEYSEEETASKDFNAFFEDFESRFIEYLKSRPKPNLEDSKATIPNWKVAVRFIKPSEITLFHNKFFKRNTFIGEILKKGTLIWEKVFHNSNNTIADHKLWRKKHLRKNIFFRIISIIIYILLWCIISWLLQNIEDGITECSYFKFLKHPGMKIVAFGFFGSLVEKSLNLRDLFESFTDVIILISDYFYYLKYLWNWDKFESIVNSLFIKLKKLLDKFKKKK